MLGSYSADPEPRNTEVISDDFPSGLVARSTYTVTSKVVDLDNSVWLGASILSFARITYRTVNGLDYKWQLKIAKDW
jgi:RHO protein GDP dissociation inhibitor